MNKFRCSRDGGGYSRTPRGTNLPPAPRSGCEVLAISSLASRFTQFSRPTDAFLIASHPNIRNRANSLAANEKRFSNRYFFGTFCPFSAVTLIIRHVYFSSTAQSAGEILRYTARHHDRHYFHVARRKRRRPQQNQNGPAPSRVRIARISRRANLHPERECCLPRGQARSRDSMRAHRKGHRAQLWISSQRDRAHRVRIARSNRAQSLREALRHGREQIAGRVSRQQSRRGCARQSSEDQMRAARIARQRPRAFYLFSEWHGAAHFAHGDGRAHAKNCVHRKKLEYSAEAAGDGGNTRAISEKIIGVVVGKLRAIVVVKKSAETYLRQAGF